MATPDFLLHVKKALMAVYGALERQGDDVRRQLKAKQDISTVGDATANNALVEYFRSSGLPLVMYTEELAEPLNLSEKPKYAVIADDVDGTANQSYGFGMLPHGPVVGIADNPDPKFSDMQAAGFLEINSGNLFYAAKGKGAFLIEGFARRNAESRRLRSSGVKKLADAKNVIADVYMLGNLTPVFSPLVLKRGGDFRSKATHFALVAAGSIDIFILADNAPNPKKRSRGEEIGPLYLLMKEAGCAVLDWDGTDLGSQKVGMAEGKVLHYVAAATEPLAKEFLSWMRKQPEVNEYLKKKHLR